MEGISICIIFAREDVRLLNQLKAHLSALKQEGIITHLHERMIGSTGMGSKQFDNASIVLLLISANFLEDYCYSIEFQRAIEQHEVRIIPFIVRPVEWERTWFGKYQAVPTNAKPITSWRNRDDGFVDVVKSIRKAVNAMRGGNS